MDDKNIKPIDLMRIVKLLWAHRRKFYYSLPATLVITFLIMICIPRYYSCEVSLAPEMSGNSPSGTLTSLASSFGLSSLSKLGGSQDAIYAGIYPEVIGSKNFIAELMTIPVKTKEGDVECSYYTYLKDKQKAAWWDLAIGKVRKWLKPVPRDSYRGDEKLTIFNLTKQQSELFNSVQDKIKCTVDKKTDIVSITVTDQDPLVCAIMADATCQKLQDFITDYRTNKARIDCEYYKKLCAKSKAEYDKALQEYAASAEANRNAILIRYQAKIENLENEMQTKYNVYTTIESQLQAAEAKLQEVTPAFTVIESASIPVKPAGPKRMLISIAMTILAFFVQVIWILSKEKEA